MAELSPVRINVELFYNPQWEREGQSLDFDHHFAKIFATEKI